VGKSFASAVAAITSPTSRAAAGGGSRLDALEVDRCHQLRATGHWTFGQQLLRRRTTGVVVRYNSRSGPAI
jgi:hypothetical protein